MGLLDSITEGVSSRPFKMLLYGPEGIGKSTFASQAPHPLFLQTEDGLDQIGPRRSPLLTSLGQFREWIGDVAKHPGACETLVIDSVTSLEALVWSSVASAKGAPSISAIPWQEGYKASRDAFLAILVSLQTIVASGSNVILIGHAKIDKFEEPGVSTYDRWSPRLHKDVSGILHQWCDMVLFAGFAPIGTKEEDKGFGKKRTIAPKRGVPRILYTQPSPSRIAKNRYDLPDEIPFTWDNFQEEFTKAVS